MQSSSQVITTNKLTPSFLQAGCPSCHPTNSVKALKGNILKRLMSTNSSGLTENACYMELMELIILSTVQYCEGTRFSIDANLYTNRRCIPSTTDEQLQYGVTYAVRPSNSSSELVHICIAKERSTKRWPNIQHNQSLKHLKFWLLTMWRQQWPTKAEAAAQWLTGANLGSNPVVNHYGSLIMLVTASGQNIPTLQVGRSGIL